MKLAQIGYGYWGRNLLRNLNELEGAQVKYVCDLSEANLAEAARRYTNVIPTRDYAQVLADPEVAAVAIATPVGSHYELGKQALLAGKHVLMEKPLAASTREAEDLVRIAKEQDRLLMVDHTFLFSPPVQKVKELLASGEVGDIHFVSSTRINLGLYQSDVSVIWDLCPHDFSILFHWFNQFPTRVSATGRACIKPGLADVAFVNLEFPSGAIAHVHVSWLAPSKVRGTILVGSNKMVIYDDVNNQEPVKVFDRGVNLRTPDGFGEFQLSYRSGDIFSPRLANTEPLRAMVQNFVGAINGTATCRSTGEFGLAIVRTLEAAEESLKLGGAPVDL